MTGILKFFNNVLMVMVVRISRVVAMATMKIIAFCKRAYNF